MKKILIIGGGAAGMLASIIAAEGRADVELFEKNDKLGKKLFITGKGRCNLTNACDMEELFQNVVTNPRFLYSSFHRFSNFDVIDFFERIGLKTKLERGNRVFPESDHSSDVIRVLMEEMKRLSVRVHYHSEVKKLQVKDGRFSGLELSDGRLFSGDACIIATGGLSYSSTGSTGDGYRFAKEIGHTVTKLFPSLVALHTKEEYVKRLQGLSLKNVEVKMVAGKLIKEEVSNNLAKKKGKKGKLPKEGSVLFQEFGEMLFTHLGVSGPIILSASSKLTELIAEIELTLHLDLKPALTREQLDARILRDFQESKNKQFKNALDHLLPQKLIDVIIELSGIHPGKQINMITKEERIILVELLKDMTFTIAGLGDYKEAVITRGGVAVKEIDPATMESKLAPGVFFAGEVLDLDAFTGGFNLQIAWSTAYAAAKEAIQRQE